MIPSGDLAMDLSQKGRIPQPRALNVHFGYEVEVVDVIGKPIEVSELKDIPDGVSFTEVGHVQRAIPRATYKVSGGKSVTSKRKRVVITFVRSKDISEPTIIRVAE